MLMFDPAKTSASCLILMYMLPGIIGESACRIHSEKVALDLMGHIILKTAIESVTREDKVMKIEAFSGCF